MELASVTTDGITVESNTATEAEMRTSLGVDTPAEESKAAPVEDAPIPANETVEQKAARERDAQGRFAKGEAEKKSVKPAQPRIDQLTWEREEARRESADLRRRLEALEQSRQPEKREALAPQRVTDPADAEPTEDKFEDYQKFLDAHARWSARDEIRQERAATQRTDAASRRQQETHQVFSGYAERIQAAAKADPEFFAKLSPEVLALTPLELLDRSARPGPLNALASEITKSTIPDKLLQHFTDHPDDLRRFEALHPREFLREFVRLETRLDTAPAPASVSTMPSVSQAKPPVKAVTASPVVGDQPPGDDADDEAHRAYWNRRDLAERTKRR